ncbi:MAG: DNA-3-methyladenine glycosylase 2 family protein [Acidimicrobiales bacterium]|nr:DNA-3-methyladenine glycosylase 2 family protein [Acidimicrobiales bacterium]
MAPSRAPRSAVATAEAALAAADPVLAGLVERAGPCRLPSRRPAATDFASLAESILYQQLHGRAAAAIHARFVGLVGGAVTPASVRRVPVEALRAAGLSRAKATAVHDLAAKVDDGTVLLDGIGRCPDDEVVRRLVQVWGIGRWTAEMFLMFQLGRLDVWPVDDFGVRTGYRVAWGLPDLPAPRALDELGERYRPYRSVVAWYCWRVVDTALPGGSAAPDDIAAPGG